jgi:FlaA1/EpsC-like NDP-sugar epimerase
VRNRHFLLSDVLLFMASTVLAFALRFEGFIWGPVYSQAALVFAAFAVPIKLAVSYKAGLYRRLWRYAGVVELERLIAAAAVFGVAGFIVGGLVLPGLGLVAYRLPLSVLLLDALLSAVALALPRVAVRVFSRRGLRRRHISGQRVIIVGAGSAGEIITKELLGHPQLGLNPIGFVDDDRRKHGHEMHDLPVLGSLAELRTLIPRHDVDAIIIAMPRAPGRVVREVVQAAMEAGVPAQTVPGLFEIISGRVSVGNLREVQIEDLLRREPIQTDLEQVRGLATGETVLVTGAGGSIGSELCRQLAKLDPARLVLLGHG